MAARSLAVWAATSVDDVYAQLGSRPDGLSDTDAAARLALQGRNTLGGGEVRALHVLFAQLANPFLILLAATAAISGVLGDATGALIILAIVGLSTGLGFLNEYRSRRVVADLRRRLRNTAIVVRAGTPRAIEVTELVTGDIVALRLGDIVPADLRLIESRDMECDEAALTGESLPVAKDASSCACMGSVVRGGAGRGIVVAVGRETMLGGIAARVGASLPQTAFQRGLAGVSALLVWITLGVCSAVFAVNVSLHGHPLGALLFALAIAVSLTPQLLPAIVTISLATGARRMAHRNVLVKRLVAIEDLGNIEVLFTDKTGTLTVGSLAFIEAVDVRGEPSTEAIRLGLLATTSPAVALEPQGIVDALDAALRRTPQAVLASGAEVRRIGEVPFDHQRRRISVLVDLPGDGQRIIVKGAPESVLACCTGVPDGTAAVLHDRFAAGYRVIAVAARPAPGLVRISAADERDLELVGLLIFADPAKPDAAASLARLADLGIRVVVVTGDNELVATRVCSELGMPVGDVVTGGQLEAWDDARVQQTLATTTIFARVSPDQKARLIRLQRAAGVDVAFLGDGVNDAVALHDADVGISVESATDVARDAADVVLVTKDLGTLADGVLEGRRIFTNTVKYVLMTTSSNLGNMLSIAGASMVLPFLPLLPTQVLLNNLLYDASETTIPSDNVDAEQIRRPAHWDMQAIGRFMLAFGPLSALADVTLFAVLLLVLHATPETFRSGFFVESFLTQTLVVFALRTRRVPFFRSRPSRWLTATTLGVTAFGVALPFSPLAGFLGFGALPAAFTAWLIAIVVAYVLLVEGVKALLFRRILRG